MQPLSGQNFPKHAFNLNKNEKISFNNLDKRTATEGAAAIHSQTIIMFMIKKRKNSAHEIVHI